MKISYRFSDAKVGLWVLDFALLNVFLICMYLLKWTDVFVMLRRSFWGFFWLVDPFSFGEVALMLFNH